MKSKRLYMYLGSIAGVFLALAISPKSALPQQTDLQNVFDKMRRASRAVHYEGTAKVELSGPDGRTRAFRKSVIHEPFVNRSEKLILTEEQKQRLQKLEKEFSPRQRERMDNWRRSSRGRSNRNIAEQPNSFTRKRVDLELLSRNYTIAMNSSEKIAERDVHFISIKPKFDLRPEINLWVDKENGLLLGQETITVRSTGKFSMKEQFETIDIKGQRERREQGERRRREGQGRRSRKAFDTKEYASLESIPGNLKDEVITPEHIPEGFSLEKIRITRERRHITVHQVYTDGLLVFSFYKTKADGAKSFKRMKQDSGRRGPIRNTFLFKRNREEAYIIVGYVHRNIVQPVLDSLPGK